MIPNCNANIVQLENTRNVSVTVSSSEVGLLSILDGKEYNDNVQRKVENSEH